MTKERNKAKKIFSIEKQHHKNLVKLMEEMYRANKIYQREQVEQKIVKKKEEFNQKKEIVLQKFSNVKLPRGKENCSFFWGSINNSCDLSKKRKLVDAEVPPSKRPKNQM